MNLHGISNTLWNAAVWLNMFGMNGHHIGHHLWQISEGEPPEWRERHAWQTRDRWVPNYFQWRPFYTDIASNFANGYIEPLCGHRSASRRPRASIASRHGCTNCARIAVQRGILQIDNNNYLDASPTYARIQQEYRDWQAAGRPDQWPLNTTT